MLKESVCVMVWTRFVWSRTGSSGELLWPQ